MGRCSARQCLQQRQGAGSWVAGTQGFQRSSVTVDPGDRKALRREKIRYPVAHLAATADDQSLLHIPVALTQQALAEEHPCVTFEHGMCFVLCIRGGMVDVRPVALSPRLPQYSDDPTLLKYSTFQALPLSQDQVELSFPAELLSYAMTSGLSLCNGVAKFRPPDVLTESQADIEMHPVPFAFMPIIRFQALLLLDLALLERVC